MQRLWTKENISPFSQFTWKQVKIEIKDVSGNLIYYHPGVEVPESWSHNAAKTFAHKYLFRGVDDKVLIDFEPLACPKPAGAPKGEWSLKQVAKRMVTAWTNTGTDNGYFDEEWPIFYNECLYAICAQYFAPNSPQWFNTGIDIYGIPGNKDGNCYIDKNGEAKDDAGCYERPPAMACHLTSIKDTLFGPSSITEYLTTETRIFRGGSGSGADWWRLRAIGEPIKAGGVSSGVMSFLKTPDVNAGCVKSGGVTRRSAKMVSLDIDHPEILDFIQWKVREERKAIALAEHDYSIEWNADGGVYQTISGQNSNNSIAIPGSFHKTRELKLKWNLIGRVKVDESKLEFTSEEYSHPQGLIKKIAPYKHGNFSVTEIINWNGPNGLGWYPIVNKIDPEELLDLNARCAWVCADPGVHYLDHFEKWNPVANDGQVKQTNPCGEYLFLENTSCNLLCLNLLKLADKPDDLDHAAELGTTALDITVSMASLPTKDLALGAHNYRTIGLGFAGLGAWLMKEGIAYDSERARDWAGILACRINFIAWKTSAGLGNKLGAFPRYEANKEHINKVLDLHQEAAYNLYRDTKEYLGLIDKQNIDYSTLRDLPVRNSFVTLCMPAGTVGIVLDAETTGIEPFFSLMAEKKLAGGGSMSIPCPAAEQALIKLQAENSIQTPVNMICDWIVKYGNLESHPELSSKPEILAIFDTAVKNLGGDRSISYQAHILMLGAIQPFLSGAASKTVNLPYNATIKDIKEVYELCYKEGVKCVAVYRDGCKMSQPLNVPGISTNPISRMAADMIKAGFGDKHLERIASTEDSVTSLISRLIDDAPEKLWLALRANWDGLKIQKARDSYIEEFTINSAGKKRKFHLVVGLTEKGEPIEVFLKCGVGGNFESAIVDVLGIAISYLLQAGMPLMRLCKKFITPAMKFEPSGFTDRPELKYVNNMIEAILKIMAMRHMTKQEISDLGMDPASSKHIEEEHENEPKETTEYKPGTIPCPVCASPIQAVGCVPCSRCGTKIGGCGG